MISEHVLRLYIGNQLVELPQQITNRESDPLDLKGEILPQCIDTTDGCLVSNRNWIPRLFLLGEWNSKLSNLLLERCDPLMRRWREALLRLTHSSNDLISAQYPQPKQPVSAHISESIH